MLQRTRNACAGCAVRFSRSDRFDLDYSFFGGEPLR
ncbi:hypothetical protein BSFP_022010 [Burkholderia stabilis]|uniref:Uncharacterized protein n=1 Tax=Burkholderia stabilis TaxID=95485 RepID=A0A1Y1BHT6_9BURK|nr:hypothetical protein BSFP_022010 [Burkholderia stabilis]